MLQAVLEDRFKFLAHIETRELPVYELKSAKSDGTCGPRFHSPSRCVPQIQAQTNAPEDGRPAPCDNKVLAGFTSTFDYQLTWTPEFLPFGLNTPDGVTSLSADPDRPSLPTALADQLGLKLESTRGPVDVLVIDHIERPSPD